MELTDFTDSRGIFKRLYCQEELSGVLSSKQIVQVNTSETFQKGSIRGMHFQNPPKCEIKFIHCIQGAVYDVVVDLRKSSKTFLQWYAIELSSQKNNMIIVPEGCAHGFQSLLKNSRLLYFHTEFYNPEYESGLRYDDPLIGINWPLEINSLSKRDSEHKLLSHNFKGIEV